MITINDLTFRYNLAADDSLRHVSLRLGNGEALGVLGSSQAGKTTFAYVIAGLTEKHFHGSRRSGEISIDDSALPLPPSAIGFVFQDASLQLSGVTETVEEEIAFSLEQFGIPRPVIRERIEEQLETFHLVPLRKRHPKSLSGGEMKMIAIACEAAKHPRLFVLDEPMDSLDARNIRFLMDVIRKLKKTSAVILLDSNAFPATELCEQILFLESGRMEFFGPAASFLQKGSAFPSLIVPEWIEAQRRLGRKNISLSYGNTIRWLMKIRTSK